MSGKLRRRNFFQLLMASPLIAATSASAGPKKISSSQDEGIGGTGQSLNGETDHGIGGTGVFGTIQRFGSIFVNGHRIRYSPDVPVFIDGARANPGALKLGQVVRVALEGSLTKPSARAIHVTSEVIGPIESIGTDNIIVLSQRIEFAPRIFKTKLELGKRVAVHGIRKPNGTLVATRIERRSSEYGFVLRGVAERDGDHLRVGNLLINIPIGSLAGRRVIVDFERMTSNLRVKRVRLEELVPGLQGGTVNVETYGEKAGKSIVAGVGITLNASAFRDITQAGHGYVDIAVRDGHLVAPHSESDRNQSREKFGGPNGPPNGPPDQHSPGGGGANFGGSKDPGR